MGIHQYLKFDMRKCSNVRVILEEKSEFEWKMAPTSPTTPGTSSTSQGALPTRCLRSLQCVTWMAPTPPTYDGKLVRS